MSALEIGDLIDRTDARIDMSIDSGAMPVLFLEDLSTTWTALRVMLKDPNARGLGGYSERREITLKMLKDEVTEMMSLASGGMSFTPAVEPLG